MMSPKTSAKFWPISLIFVVVLQLQLLNFVHGKNYYTEVETLTPSQRKALDNLKRIVSPIVPHDYMKKDIFLVKFMQYNNFNIPKTEKQIKELLEWREKNKVDELLENPPEHLKAMYHDFPIYTDGFDKEGRPICEFFFGSFKIRKAALGGYLKNVSLHMQVNCAERVTMNLREQQAKGINVTQFVLLINMEGFSVAEQACPSCIPAVVSLVASNDKYYPNLAHGMWLINTPPEFSILLRFMRPAMSPNARAAFKIFDSDESVWRPYLEERVDYSQISDWYGGDKVRRNDL